MAHFYGTIRGRRGEASRLGGKDSGLTVYAASWQASGSSMMLSATARDFASTATHVCQ